MQKPTIIASGLFLIVILFFALKSKNNAQVNNPRPVTTPTEDSAARSPEVLPKRKWAVLDPVVSAEAVLITSLDTDISYYRQNTAEPWPAASLTKLISAIVVKENIGEKAKVTITERAEKSEGVAGRVKAGEEYLTIDLLKIMLLTSSNDAAVAFEDFVSGTESFTKLMAEKSQALSLQDSVFFDASGLNDLNTVTARDMETLMRYIAANQPDLLAITRTPEVLSQPLNSSELRTVANINPLVQNNFFLGGKTGTSDSAKQNLAAVILDREERLLFVILGSSDRIKDLNTLMTWLNEAYDR